MQTFAQFLREKALQQDVKYTALAKELGLSKSYIHDISKGLRKPPKDLETLRKIADFLNMKESEENLMYDLAGIERDTVSPDLVPYIMTHDMARLAIRKASKLNLNDDFWLKVIDLIEKTV